MVRTFVAIDLPEDLRERARESQEILKRSSGRLAIVDPANLHLTVKFLGGEIDPAQVDPVVEALRAVRAAPFSLTVGYPVCNPPRKPRVIWCDVTDGGGESAALARQVDDLLAPLGFSRETRPFRPPT
ncbi:RNA 2',3'-cyclic phosphodiesterase [Methanoculleus chikugoensis]|uniref:RNA 2',3'-cyclic phosphodiesterase n=1 Tax=Methanoculleus chikugoensis TaxID=118126 RepID=UPI0006D25D87|nr:RNA 2',3'-cyclic phosphodiesterase [Methanoculleus chikugoensis]